MSIKKSLNPNPAVSVLDCYVSLVVQKGMTHPKRGPYILFNRNIWHGDSAVGIYFANAVFTSDTYSSKLEGLDICPVWVVPVNSFESEILETKGWPQLDEYWDKNLDIDITDPFRASSSTH